ncbi:MAG: (Fe-S)-binding protein [Calditrichaeota bacterium]|nr:MAG: (Fe-S)-binding protein [Calditrichota bacterium]
MNFSGLEQIILSLLLILSLTKFLRDFFSHIRPIFKGQADRIRTDHFFRRALVSIKEVLFQSRVISGRPVAGAMHAAIFGGFIFFGLETADHFGKIYGFHLLISIFGDWTGFYKNLVSFWAIAVSVGIIGLILRRFVFVKYSPDPKSYSSGYVGLFIFLLMATYLYTQFPHDPASLTAKSVWWSHALIILIFPHLVLRSKHFHLIIAPVNIFMRTLRMAELMPMDLNLEEMESDDAEPVFGLETMANLSQKHRMDFLSCVECRRCTDNCPANISGQVLDPRGFILAGRKALFDLPDTDSVIGNIISEEALGQCTSCGACEYMCPVGIEHLQLLTGAKRAQAMSLGTGMVASEFFETVERTGNAFGGNKKERKALLEELEIPVYVPGETEFLLWMGCVWNYNVDSRDALESFIKILKKSNTSFGVLKKETCCGHHQRRQGEEMQFQDLAEKNISSMDGIKKIITPCPHCMHTIGKEYTDFNNEHNVEIIHHAQFIQKLVAKDALNLKKQDKEVNTTFHDPCYLGRYEGDFNTSRKLINSIGYNVVEMQRSHDKAVCCGGGNAGFVREQKVDKRVDQTRKEHVRESGAQLLVTACPECKMMLNAAVEETKDIAQVVAEAIE